MIKIILLALLGTFLLSSSVGGDEKKMERLSLSAPNLKIEKDEMITEFKTTVLGGFIVSIPLIPPGWSMNIINQPQWKTVLTAKSTNNFELRSKEKVLLNDFLIIEKAKSEGVEVEVEIITERWNQASNLMEKKSYTLKMEDLKLVKLK